MVFLEEKYFSLSRKTGNNKSLRVKNDGSLMVSKIFVKPAITKCMSENRNAIASQAMLPTILFRNITRKRFIL